MKTIEEISSQSRKFLSDNPIIAEEIEKLNWSQLVDLRNVCIDFTQVENHNNIKFD